MSAVAVPQRSLEQQMSALQRANEIRVYRARLKEDISAGRALVPDLVSECPEVLESMKVRELLLAQRGWGRVKTDKFLRVRGVSPSKTLGGLTHRQRMDLVRGLYGQPPAR